MKRGDDAGEDGVLQPCGNFKGLDVAGSGPGGFLSEEAGGVVAPEISALFGLGGIYDDINIPLCTEDEDNSTTRNNALFNSD